MRVRTRLSTLLRADRPQNPHTRFNPERVVMPLFCAALEQTALKTKPCLHLLAAKAAASLTASRSDLCARAMTLLVESQKQIPGKTAGNLLSRSGVPSRACTVLWR